MWWTSPIRATRWCASRLASPIPWWESPTPARSFTRSAIIGTSTRTGWREYLDASAYDGVAAHLVDSLPLPDAWPHPAFVLGDLVLVGDPGDSYSTNAIPPALETWTLSSGGKFTRLASQRVNAPISDMAAFQALFAVDRHGFDRQPLWPA